MVYFLHRIVTRLTTLHSMQPESNPSIAVPVSIIFGFALIAVAIFFSGSRSTEPTLAQNNTAPAEVAKTSVRPVDSSDMVRGNPNAPIKIVEYSDYDCQFCKQFHDTMHLIMRDYGVTGKVDWVYRQFPIVQLHPNAPKISEAAICVQQLGGTEAFWKFSDIVFSSRDSNDKTNMTRLPEYAEKAGVKRSDFSACFDNSTNKHAVDESVREAKAAGAQGTPYTIIIVGDQQAVISGAQPYTYVKQIVDNLVKQLDNSEAPTATPSATTTKQ